jgi:coniferyl-aldehyde dehydrogenase
MSAIPLHSATPLDVTRNALQQTLDVQRAAYFADPVPTFAQRKADLLKLKAFIRDNRDALLDAVSADYGNRSRHETLFAEVFNVIDSVDHTLKHLKKWMKPQRRGVDMKNFFGASNRVIPQPLGIVGAIVPWNFPINLAFNGLVATFAAGNRSMVKMSENSRHLAKFLIEKIPAYFPRDKLAFFDETGGGWRRVFPAQVRPPAVHRLRPDRSRRHGLRSAKPVPGDAGAGRQIARHRLR